MVPKQKKYGVFISYSRVDERLVSPIVELISSLRKDLVFQDIKELKPGKKWEPSLMEALDSAKVVIVFWCKHSAKSKYVKKEYEKAILGNKDILPVLLDTCQLDKSLEEYKWIDLKDVIAHKKPGEGGEDEYNVMETEYYGNPFSGEEVPSRRVSPLSLQIAYKIADVLDKKLPIHLTK